MTAARLATAPVPVPPAVGTVVSGTGATQHTPASMVMAQSAQMWPMYDLTVGGVPFTLGVDAAGGVIRYVSTTDARFATPEGVRVGTDFKTVAAVAGSRGLLERGWSYVVELPSGWNAAFGHGDEMNPGPIADGDRVKWVFQRIGYGERRADR